MPSENNHIDNFFRNKDKEVITDNARLETDWLQMKDLLITASIPSSPDLKHVSLLKKYLPYAAMIALVATTAAIIVNKKNKTGNSGTTTVHTKKEIPLHNLPSQEKTTPPQIVNSNKYDDKKTKENITQKFAARIPFINHTQPNNDTPVLKIENRITDLPDAKTVYENFYRQLEKPAEQFVINNKADTLIRCAEGTSLFIPAGCFQTTAGLAITTAVTVYIREFYSYADIVGNKLTTTSNGKALETGGMININAKAENNPVQIKTGSALQLKMPAKNFDPTMQLFVGSSDHSSLLQDPDTIIGENTSGSITRNFSSSGSINWMEAGQQQFFFNEKYKDITLFNVTDNPHYVTNYKNGTKILGKFIIPNNASISTEEMKLELEKRYGHYYDKIKVRRTWGRLFRKEKQKNTPKNDWVRSPYVGDSITLLLSIACRMKLITRDDSIQYEAGFRKQYEEAVKQRKAYADYVQKREAYSFSISNLGWINCDRFLSYPKSRLTEYVLNPGEGFEASYFTAILIFKEERSAMPGYWSNGKIRFPNLPLGHVVNIICAGVKEGKMYIAVQNAAITRDEVDGLKFEVTSPEEFRQKLSRFGNVTKRN